MSGSRENGWNLRSDGYMTSKCVYQLYLPHPGECHVVASATDGLMTDSPRKRWELSCGHSLELDGLEPPACCPVCRKLVTR